MIYETDIQRRRWPTDVQQTFKTSDLKRAKTQAAKLDFTAVCCGDAWLIWTESEPTCTHIPHTHNNKTQYNKVSILTCLQGWAQHQITRNSITHYIRQEKPQHTSKNKCTWVRAHTSGLIIISVILDRSSFYFIVSNCIQTGFFFSNYEIRSFT